MVADRRGFIINTAGMVADKRGDVELEPRARQYKKIPSSPFFRSGSGSGVAVAHQEGLLCKILSFLPLRKVHQLRLVCKSWDSLLTSPAFKQDWSRTHSGQEDGDDGETCWLVMVRKKPDDAGAFARELIAFDSATGTWISLMPFLAACPPAVLSSLGGPTCRNVANSFYYAEHASFCDFMAVGTGARSGGLVCFLCSPLLSDDELMSDWDWESAYKLSDYSLLVLNILTGSYSLIPPLPKQSGEVLSMWDHIQRISLQPLTPPHYRVFLQDPTDHRFPGPLEIYDSQSSSWNVGRSCCGPKDAKVACAADLHRADLLQYTVKTHTVFAYNVDADEWCQVYAPLELWTGPMGFFPHGKVLLKHWGRILLAGAQFKPFPATAMMGFSVWELQLHSPPDDGAELQLHSPPDDAAAPRTPIAEWIQVATTPPQYWDGMYDIHKNDHVTDVKLIFSGSLICMTAVHYSDTYYGGTYYPPLVYDLVRDSWYHLPPYKGHKDFMASFCVQPSFVATA